MFTQHPGIVITHDQYYQAFPHISKQVTNAGVRRSGYEATVYPLYHTFLNFTWA